MLQIKFNPENKAELTYGECLEPAMKITDQFVADRYLKDYIAYTEKMLQIEPSKKGMTAEEICKINLAYWAGYYDNTVRTRIEHLFQCSHLIFGSIADNGSPTPEEALQAGKIAGENAKALKDLETVNSVIKKHFN